MALVTNLTILYAYDNLRGDGLAVRWARLGMLTDASVVVALCWLMECLFFAAFYGRGAVKSASIVGFWVAYLAILIQV